jgi:hypothetical protein
MQDQRFLLPWIPAFERMKKSGLGISGSFFTRSFAGMTVWKLCLAGPFRNRANRLPFPG